MSTSRTGRGEKARDLSSARTGDRAPDASGFWADRAAWWVLLGGLILSVVAVNQPHVFTSVAYLKDWTVRIAVSTSFALWGVSLAAGKNRVRWHPLGWLAAAYVLWAGVTVVFSVSPATAFAGTGNDEAGWLSLVAPVMGGFLALQLVDRASRVRLLLRSAVATSALVALYGAIQSLGLDPMRYDSRPWGALRAFSTLGNPDLYGLYTALMVPLAVALLLYEEDRAWKAVAAVAAVLLLATNVSALSRGGWIGVVVGLAALMPFALRLRLRPGRFEYLAAGVLVLLLGVLVSLSATAADSDSNIAARASGAAVTARMSTSARLETWKIAGRAIAERPVLGWGPDTFSLAFEQHRTRAFSEVTDPGVTSGSAHDWPIQAAVETGMLGLLLLAVLYGAVAVASARWIWTAAPKEARSHWLFAGAWAACAGYLAAGAFSPSSRPVQLLFWCLLAVLLSPLTGVREAIPARAERFGGYLAVATAGGFALVALFFGYADNRASVAMDVSRPPEFRAAAGRSAMRYNPLSSRNAISALNALVNLVPATGAATGGGRSAAFDDALAAARRAVALEPASPYPTDGLIGLLLIGGQDVDPAYAANGLAEAKRAVERWPNHLEPAYWYARALAETGREEQALTELRSVLSIRPGYAQAALLAADLLVASGDAVAARDVLGASLAQVRNLEVESRLQSLESVSQPTPSGAVDAH